jgi:hypothetical protein
LVRTERRSSSHIRNAVMRSKPRRRPRRRHAHARASDVQQLVYIICMWFVQEYGKQPAVIEVVSG